MSLHAKKLAKDAADIEAKQARAKHDLQVRQTKSLQAKLRALRATADLKGTGARLRQACTIRMLMKRIEMEENSLDDARAERDDKDGLARAAAFVFEQHLIANSVPSGRLATGPVLERPSKRARGTQFTIPLPSWTTGKIYSGSAQYWCPNTGGWVEGYPHLADPRRTQRFILHLDTGNSGYTCITRETFEYLGLSRSLQPIRQARIVGVNNQSRMCEIYQIKFTMDLANKAHPEPGHIYQRTVEAAVIESRLSPGQVGYHDLLLCAEDIRKFLNLDLPGEKKLRLEVLAEAPPTLYDGQQLKLKERFSQPAAPAAPPPRALRPRHFPSQSNWPDFPDFPDFPGFEDFHRPNRHVSCSVIAVA